MQKMISEIEPPVLSEGSFIQEGAVAKDGSIVLACTVGDPEYDDALSEIVLLSRGECFKFRARKEYFVSIDLSEKGDAYVLGEHGTVVKFRWEGIESEADLKSSRVLFPNALAVETGPMRRLRVIGDTAFCVGAFGQAYQVSSSEIEPMAFLETYSDPVIIKEIAGTSASDLIAVTQQGSAARFDGSQWTDLQLPTNLKLTGITQVDQRSYAIVGSGGNLFVGDGDLWEHHKNKELPRDYYSVAVLDGLIYLSHIAGIDTFDGTEFREITYDDKARLEFAFMTRGPGSIWAFSGRTVGEISKEHWVSHLRRAD